jgi:hypothetical protein
MLTRDEHSPFVKVRGMGAQENCAEFTFKKLKFFTEYFLYICTAVRWSHFVHSLVYVILSSVSPG